MKERVKEDVALFEKCFKICESKFDIHMAKTLPDAAERKESETGDYYSDEPGFPLSVRWNWLTSMVTGMAPILNICTGDKKYLDWADSFAEEYDKKVSDYYTQTMHDVGFLYLPYSVHLYNITGDEKHKRTALKAATELAKRFNIDGRFIEAWDEMNLEETERRMIVDALMNTPLLLWAWKETGHTFYRDVAKAHADTVIKVLVRDDWSVKHAVMFNADGTVKCEANNCGYANGSHWARGTAWAVYGFLCTAKYTGEEKYLDAAKKIFAKYRECLAEEGADGGVVPVWDFRLPKDMPAYKCRNTSDDEACWDQTLVENKKYNRDSSAAAIMGCAMFNMYELTGDEEYLDFAHKTLKVLCEKYLDEREDIPGMLKVSNGRNVYSTYGDYYFFVLLTRTLTDNKDVCVW